MSIPRFVICAAAAGALALPVALSSTAALATPAGAAKVGSGCRVYNYTGAHWSTSHKQHAAVTHTYQLNLPRNGSYTETKTEGTVKQVSSNVKLSASLKYSEDAIFESVEVSVKGSVSKFHKKTTSKSISDTIHLDNKGGQTTYIMFSGVTVYTGVAKYYNCVSHDKQGTGTIQVTHSAPWTTFSGNGGGAVQCGSKSRHVSALARAAEAYC